MKVIRGISSVLSLPPVYTVFTTRAQFPRWKSGRSTGGRFPCPRNFCPHLEPHGGGSFCGNSSDRIRVTLGFYRRL